MKIALLGFAREGQSVLKFIKKTPQYKNAEIWILDKNSNLANLVTSDVANIKFQTGKDYLKNLDKFDLIFRTPGAPYNLSEIQKAVKRGVKFSSATKLFFDEAQKIGCKIIGITGTKGKGTTSTLLYKILKACPEQGRRVYLAGNIGKSAIDLIPKINKKSIVILELSSFQLQDMEKSPDIAVVLDIFPDHMDAHKNLQEYFDAKANIAKWQKKSDKIFYSADNSRSKWIASKSAGKKIAVNSRHSHTFADWHYDFKMPGEHNLKNAAMAATVALSLGCPKEKIVKVVKNFKGNEHRLEFVRKINGINFYNDSASTNPQTAAAAVKSFKEPKILIAGGKDKGLNYSHLADALKNSNTKLVILFGENKDKIAKAILSRKYKVASSKYKVVLVKDLKSAVNLAYREAKILNTKYHIPATIIFSPASASFDMFKDYADRGKKFKELVKKLK